MLRRACESMNESIFYTNPWQTKQTKPIHDTRKEEEVVVY